MKQIRALLPLALAALVVAPTAASAAFDPPPPGSYCVTNAPSVCVSFADGEATIWTQALGGRQVFTSEVPASGGHPAIPRGSVRISWNRTKFAFAGIPDGTDVLYQSMSHVAMLYTPEGEAVRPLAVNATTRSYDTTAIVCHFYRHDEGNGASLKVARDDTPADVFAGCGFERRHSDPAPESTRPAAQRPAAAPTAAKVTKCKAIRVARRGIAVTSQGVGCYGARNILARYMKTGKKPKGFKCTKRAVGKARAASCVRPGKAAKKITGRWRV